jgi:GH25 family lysozyme M1 (1,4-beta-N-acetylmuramidase)
MKKSNLYFAVAIATMILNPYDVDAARDFGIDVSHFQGETGISQSTWNQMFLDGKRFVFIKASESTTFVDLAAPNNVTRATAAGLRAGVYHFAHPEQHPTTNGAIQEADFFLSTAGNFIGPGYLRPVLDLEVGSVLSTADLTSWVIAFSDEIVANRGAGAAPIIYCTQGYAQNELDSRMANYDLWLRTITGVDPSTGDPPLESGTNATGVFNNWSFWQYADTGSSGGITPLDLDVCHSELKSLDSFLIPTNPNPVPPAITAQPQSRTIRVGNFANFNVGVSVSSSPPLSYQWRFNSTDIGGATAGNYTVTGAQLSDSGNYTVVITNSAGSVTSAVAVLTVLSPPPPVPPVVLYQENFDEYGNESIVTSSGVTNGFNILFGAASGPQDFSARFGFDYSTVFSPTLIPSAPHSTGATTKGLRLTVNKDITAAVASVNLYPVSQTFTGNFALKFDLWINYPNSSTATEHSMFGINHSGSVTNRIGQPGSDGLFFAMDGDGGSSAGTTIRDFAVFRGGGAGVSPILMTTNNTTFGPDPLVGPQFDNADPGFGALFPPKTLPTFATVSGSAGNAWVNVEVSQITNVITWSLNDTVVAQYTNNFAFTSGEILLGYADVFSSIGGADNFAVFDNVRVETVPDIDGNGLPDAWELQYFGHIGVDLDADADGDGVSNFREYLAGTNPTNAASVFRILGVARNGKDIRVDWTTVGGHSYIVQSTTDINGTFADLSAVIAAGGTGEGATNYVHVGAGTNQSRFYRIQLKP